MKIPTHYQKLSVGEEKFVFVLIVFGTFLFAGGVYAANELQTGRRKNVYKGVKFILIKLEANRQKWWEMPSRKFSIFI